MRYTVSMKQNFQFRRMYKSAPSNADPYLVLYYRKNHRKENCLGITVSKKIGNAVTRNRVRRLIKENYRLSEEQIRIGYDLIVVARIRAAGADFSCIRSSLSSLLCACGLEKET